MKTKLLRRLRKEAKEIIYLKQVYERDKSQANTSHEKAYRLVWKQKDGEHDYSGLRYSNVFESLEEALEAVIEERRDLVFFIMSTKYSKKLKY